MHKVSGGYTILELMIVLAVSVIILGGAILTVRGSSARTEFAESMRDVNSSMQDWMNDVTDGFTGGNPATYTCKITASKPRLVPRYANNTPDCVFVGKALQVTDGHSCPTCVTDQSSKIYIYSIFGERLSGSAFIDNMSEAVPVPAIGNAISSYQTGLDLTETYNILNGASVIKTKINGTTTTGALFGFFNSFNGSAVSSNGAQTLNAYYYPLATNSAPANTTSGTNVIKCLEMSTPCIPAADLNPPALNSAQICFASNLDSELAVLTITSDNGLGAQTTLNFVNTCP